MKYKITLISDTHNKHWQIGDDLPGGDLLLHAGDISSMGYKHEIKNFCDWFEGVPGYKHKVFISGNHDWGFEDNETEIGLLLKNYPGIEYLQDSMYVLGDDYQNAVKIWGSPWQPRFHDWAFNADRGEDIKQYWDKIPNDIDILITHGPAYGFLDKVYGRDEHLGCEELTKAIDRLKPKIHLCGHIHSGNGYAKYEGNDTHFFNAAVLGENYTYTYKPKTIEWDSETNTINFI